LAASAKTYVNFAVNQKGKELKIQSNMNYDVIIIGAGPAGYVAAIRAGQVGLKTLLVEKEKVGGMCLNWGCIPSKSLIESAKFLDRLSTAKEYGIDGLDLGKISFNWQAAIKKTQDVSSKLSKGIQFLLEKNGVELVTGEAEIVSNDSVTVNNRNFNTKSIIIATGSIPAAGDNAGELDLREFYKLEKLPENVAFIGSGPVAVEMAQMANLAGSKAYIVSDQDKLIPILDDYLNDFLKKKLKKCKVGVVASTQELPKGTVLVNARARKAILPKSKPELKLDDSGFLITNSNFMTAVEGIYAIGDVNGKSSFAHVASAQGMYAVNHIKGITTPVDFERFPINIYTSPEIAQVGMTEQQLSESDYDFKVSSFPLSANAKALISGNTEGEVRILSEKVFGEVLGVQIIAENATDMIAEASAYMAMEGTVYDIASTIHAHPTISEIFMEAGFEAISKAIHK